MHDAALELEGGREHAVLGGEVFFADVDLPELLVALGPGARPPPPGAQIDVEYDPQDLKELEPEGDGE